MIWIYRAVYSVIVIVGFLLGTFVCLECVRLIAERWHWPWLLDGKIDTAISALCGGLPLVYCIYFCARRLDLPLGWHIDRREPPDGQAGPARHN
jgi:hypothetical protein